jgi:hypothetical protein
MKNLNKLTILLLSLIFIFLHGCQSVQDNLSLKKKESSEEFLVEKKNPLVLPPNFGDLPKPLSEEKIINQKDQEVDLSKIFKNSKKLESKNNSDINKSLEDSIREKIGNK